MGWVKNICWITDHLKVMGSLVFFCLADYVSMATHFNLKSS